MTLTEIVQKYEPISDENIKKMVTTAISEGLYSSESDALDALIDNNHISHRPDLSQLPD
jgi:hypothetical protein|tara:strand:+ start:377 stop:553 length:177 start_codon:yes stop_codon:yes gene_type:complete